MQTTEAAPRPASGHTVNHAPAWLRLPLFFAALAVRLWLATLRIHVAPERMAQWREQAGRGRLFLLWHNRLILCPALKRRFAPRETVNGLISASKDGAWLTAFFRRLGIRVIRGSSSWRGEGAMLEIVRHLAAGEDVGITPDGPRGPCYGLKSGSARIAHKTGHPVFLVGLRFHAARRLRSWDGFYLPAPFSRVDLLLDYVAPDDPARALTPDEFAANLRARLLAITDDT
jgi:lysophospholipid acyltransferase (LPLAT)-like uncharacterized protein